MANMSDHALAQQVLERSAMFEGLAKESMEQLIKTVRTVKMGTGKVLFRKGDLANGCYFLIDGILKVSILMAETDEETLLALVGQGDVIGEMSLVDRKPRSATITALKDSHLVHLSHIDFYKLADKDTEIYRHLLRYMSLRIRLANDRLEEQKKSLTVRLAVMFLRMVDAFGEELPDGRILVRHKMSQAEMARMIVAARENVNRQLSSWKKEAVISRISSYYCVNDIEALQAIASGYHENWDD